MHRLTPLSIGLAALLIALPSSVMAASDGASLYQQHCQSCHAPERLGAQGPALLPESLARLPQKAAVQVISQGRPATQMPGFAQTLSGAEINTLAAYLYEKPSAPPHWDAAQINTSHQVFNPRAQLPAKPVFTADPLNLFVVVESGNHHINILDGDKFEVITRFPTHFALHGGPKFSPDGRFVFWASRDGWVTQYDLWNLKPVAQVRAGINTRNIASSQDGRYLMVANYLPNSLVVLNAEDLSLNRVIEVTDQQGTASRVSAVYTAPPRNSFIAALKDVQEIWEIPYDKPDFPVRRLRAGDYLDDFSFDPQYRHLLATSRDSHGGQVVDLDAGKVIKKIPLQGMPHLGSGISWTWQGRPVMATPNIQQGRLSVIGLDNWEIIKEIPTEGPGFFLRSHVNSPYAWTDVFFGPNQEVVQVIDKQNLSVAKTLRPMPGKNAAHVEFDRYGKHVLLSVWDQDGALIIYNADTLEEIKRLPMNKPSGKYNVFNKINYAEGTSH
ncbi:cytochrome D1 domain-containing protein [Atopomonas sediminilitoris]|uniref:cytochrome D1 domain-containing protein n=1 Tax=Atopomonas sediminilitoris TaxID=2919919 RepID=UPI001F4E8772|nr:cytochrome D1 domain-containing protein [Atopomonas sediminilitoris]MCJ8170850.1 nitrite reductase [Atopomonas sediminilitoris]